MQRLIIILALLAGSVWADTKLTWDAGHPGDDATIKNYELYLQGAKVATVGPTTYAHTYVPKAGECIQPGAAWTGITVNSKDERSALSAPAFQSKVDCGPAVTLAAPRNVKLATGDKTVTVSWDAVPGATAYNVVLDGSVIATVKGLSSLRTVPVGKCVVPGNKYAVQAVGGPLSATVSVKGNVCNVSC